MGVRWRVEDLGDLGIGGQDISTFAFQLHTLPIRYDNTILGVGGGGPYANGTISTLSVIQLV